VLRKLYTPSVSFYYKTFKHSTYNFFWAWKNPEFPTSPSLPCGLTPLSFFLRPLDALPTLPLCSAPRSRRRRTPLDSPTPSPWATVALCFNLPRIAMLPSTSPRITAFPSTKILLLFGPSRRRIAQSGVGDIGSGGREPGRAGSGGHEARRKEAAQRQAAASLGKEVRE
jgi:hypothetical protein